MVADGCVVMEESRGFRRPEASRFKVFADCYRDFLRPITNDVTGWAIKQG